MFGYKGYRACRTSSGVSEGAWFFEVECGAEGHYRIGWGTEEAELGGPVGMDKFSFGFRDIRGMKVYSMLLV